MGRKEWDGRMKGGRGERGEVDEKDVWMPFESRLIPVKRVSFLPLGLSPSAKVVRWCGYCITSYSSRLVGVDS